MDKDTSTFNLNVFVLSANSVIEYVESDFVLVMIRPYVHGRKWQYKKFRNNTLKNHEQSKTLNNFHRYYSKQKDELLDIPLVNYFRYKGNKIVHRRWDGIKNESYTEHSDGRKQMHKTGESETTLYFAQKDPNYDGDICYSQIPREKQISLLTRLYQEDVIPILHEYLQCLQDFIDKFDNKDFFN